MELTREATTYIADQVRECVDPISPQLCEPFTTPEQLLEVNGTSRLCSWVVFHPLRFVVVDVFLTPVSGRDERLLFRNIEQAVQSDIVVDGLIPEGICSDALQLAIALTPLFERNGSAEHPLLRSLPTHIAHIEESLLPQETLRELLFLAAAHVVDAEELAATCDFLTAYRDDPWSRVSKESRAAAKAQRAEQPTRRHAPPDRSQLERWWSLVTNPEHVSLETSLMPEARDLAENLERRARSGGATAQPPPEPCYGLFVSGQAVEITDRFGYDRRHPVTGAAHGYCSRLRCPNDHPFWFHRVGSVGSGPDGHILDLIELLCFGRECYVTLFFDMYHKGMSAQLPEGLSLGTPAGTGSAHHCYLDFPNCFERERRS